ncbi:DUF2690 domain-containing protein [Actinopolyspora mortivallis]|uniref:DUF2690 domain-containing protein n=1 Tax=Actinopolyspora mortivallis TaxID=33906 RepID=A0A2T0GW00_ACTMO|nr:hypothetical protein CEP50_11590 [Actinopolyspora mortivallis]
MNNKLKLLTVFSFFGVCCLIFTGLIGAGSASAASCYGGSCTGKDPRATGCSADARTIDRVIANGRQWQLRYSPSCDATWGRMLRPSVQGDTVNLDGIPPESKYEPYTFSTTFPSHQVWPGPQWTMMGAHRDKTRVCGRYGTPSPGGGSDTSKWYCSEWH